MKSLKLRLLMLCLGTVLTLGLSHTAAQTCIDTVAGSNVYGDYDCRFTQACAGWCYYNCNCTNLFPGYTCNNVLMEAGFELVEGPQC
jgi:hypothetical protein